MNRPLIGFALGLGLGSFATKAVTETDPSQIMFATVSAGFCLVALIANLLAAARRA
jgi:hypothetical protein